MKTYLSLFLVLLLSMTAKAEEIVYEGPHDWDSFNQFMIDQEEEERVRGVGYLISGTLAVVGGASGYYSSDDALTRGIHSVIQSVGVAAIGYGASQYYLGNEYSSFYRAVEGSSLTGIQKTELLRRFLDFQKEKSESRRMIRITTHSLIALLNFYHAQREEDKDVRDLLNILGAVNVAISLSLVF